MDLWVNVMPLDYPTFMLLVSYHPSYHHEGHSNF